MMNTLKIKKGYFGNFGGIFLPRELEQLMEKLSDDYDRISRDEEFQNKLRYLYRNYCNRPSLLYYAENLSKKYKGPQIYLKREDLNHTGAHKINNAVGQALFAKRLGKKKLIAETGAGQHGVATATVAAYFGMECEIFMGERDIVNQKSNVYRMKLLGAKVTPVKRGRGTLKDAVDEALENYLNEIEDSYYLLGSVVGPHPYPTMVRDFQKVIGEEIKEQVFDLEGRLPDSVIACVGGGSNAMGAFYDFVKDEGVELVAVEPAGKGAETKLHGLSLKDGSENVIHGFKTLVITEEDGEVGESYSAASGLDYPGVGPELSMLYKSGRLKLGSATDREAVKAFGELSTVEGIIPALESAHAVAYLMSNIEKYGKNDVVVINLSGRGDKDVENVFENFID